MGGIREAGRRRRIVVSCEHATHRLPPRYRTLGLTPTRLRSHISWDKGASIIARHCAQALACPYHRGRFSRLLIDLNRSPHNPKLIPRRSFGVPVPGNQHLSRHERRLRLQRYYEPYRRAVLTNIKQTISRRGFCLHLSIHTFTPKLGNQVRDADLGILYDPRRPAEQEIASLMQATLALRELRVRRNYPYRGTADGFTTFCRKIWPDTAYAGIEIEVNQRLLKTRRTTERAGRTVAECLRAALHSYFGTPAKRS